MAWQGHPNTSATLLLGIGRAVDSDLSIMLFNDGIDQRKAKSGSFARIFGGKERFEQTVHDGLWNSTAFVFDDEVDGVLEYFAFDPYCAACRGCVTGVGQQIDQDLRQTLRITDGPVFGVAQVIEVYFEIAPVQRQQTNSILSHFGQTDGFVAVLMRAGMGKTHQ